MTNDAPHLRPLAKWVRHGTMRVLDPDLRQRVDLYLAQRFGYRSRTQWAQMIVAGRILVNGQKVRPSRIVTFGDRLDYRPISRTEAPVTALIPILYEDEVIFAVDKPAHLAVHPVGRHFRHTLLLRLLELRGETLDAPGIRIVHRLDGETSGVVLFGKTRAATAFLAGQFEKHRVQKEYLALVHGVPATTRFTVDADLGPNPDSRVRKAVGVVPSGEGRSAVTDFELVAGGRDHALLRARPRTGRLHQIRVHLKHAGWPIVGDKLYGLDEGYFLKQATGAGFTEEDRRVLLLSRQGLHAHRITLLHPQTKAPFTCVAPVPDDLRKICQELGVDLTDVDQLDGRS